MQACKGAQDREEQGRKLVLWTEKKMDVGWKKTEEGVGMATEEGQMTHSTIMRTEAGLLSVLRTTGLNVCTTCSYLITATIGQR